MLRELTNNTFARIDTKQPRCHVQWSERSIAGRRSLRGLGQRDHVHGRDFVLDAKFHEAEAIGEYKRFGSAVGPVPNILEIETSIFVTNEPLHNATVSQEKTAPVLRCSKL